MYKKERSQMQMQVERSFFFVSIIF